MKVSTAAAIFAFVGFVATAPTAYRNDLNNSELAEADSFAKASGGRNSQAEAASFAEVSDNGRGRGSGRDEAEAGASSSGKASGGRNGEAEASSQAKVEDFHKRGYDNDNRRNRGHRNDKHRHGNNRNDDDEAFAAAELKPREIMLRRQQQQKRRHMTGVATKAMTSVATKTTATRATTTTTTAMTRELLLRLLLRPTEAMRKLMRKLKLKPLASAVITPVIATRDTTLRDTAMKIRLQDTTRKQLQLQKPNLVEQRNRYRTVWSACIISGRFVTYRKVE